MFNFFKAKAPAEEIASVLWEHVMAFGATLSGSNSGLAYEEAVFYCAFIVDAAILGVFRKRPNELNSLRNHFYLYATMFAQHNGCGMPPAGEWPAQGNMWKVTAPAEPSDDYPRMIVDRFNLYASAFRREWEPGKNMPATLVLAALSNNYDISFVMGAAQAYMSMTKTTGELLNKLRIVG